MRPLLLVCPLAIPLLVAACSPDAHLAAKAESPEARYASETIRLLREKQLEELISRLGENAKAEVSPAALEEIAVQFPASELVSETLIGYAAIFGAHPHRVLTFEYAFESGFAVVEVVVRGRVDAFSVARIQLWPTERSLKETHAFTLAGKSGRHYLILSLAVVIPLLSLYALIQCLRTADLRHRWRWVLFIVFGLGQVSLNWTTGELGANWQSVSLLGATAFTASPYAPWIISVSVPLGALVFLFWRRRWKPAAAPIPEPESPTQFDRD